MTTPKAGKPHPPFGATAAHAKRHQELRDLKNRIFELQGEVASLKINAPISVTCSVTGTPLGDKPVALWEYRRVVGVAEGLRQAVQILATGKMATEATP